MESVSKVVCLTLDRSTFIAILGPLEHIMQREKSSQVVAQRLMKLQVRRAGGQVVGDSVGRG